MIEKLECRIDKSLHDVFAEFQFPEYLEISFLDSNEAFETQQYSILVLNDELFPLNSENRFRSEEQFDVIAYYKKRNNNPRDIVNACEVLLEIYNTPGVLSLNQIKALMQIGILIYGGDEKKIQIASYDLSLHDEFLRSGVRIEKKDIISIEPFAYVVVGAKEFANLPTNICANYDLRVSMFCRGIILSNGPQVDPGYRGALLALLFNTSSKQFDMEQYTGYEFATIQFLALSSPAKRRYSGENLLKKSLSEYIRQYADEAMSEKVATLFTLKESTESLEAELKKISSQIDNQATKLKAHDSNIEHLKGRNTKWALIITCIIGLIAVLYSAIATFSGNNKVYDLGLLIGNVQGKIDSANKQIADIEVKSKTFNEAQKDYSDEIKNLKLKIENFEEQLEYIQLEKHSTGKKQIDSQPKLSD